VKSLLNVFNIENIDSDVIQSQLTTVTKTANAEPSNPAGTFQDRFPRDRIEGVDASGKRL